MLTAVFALLVAVAVSLLVIPVAWRLAPALGLIDRPSARKVHVTPVPRVGGFGIVFGTLFAVFIVLPLDTAALSFLIGGLVLLAFGLWDDALEVGPLAKLLGQVAATAIVVYYGDLWVSRLPLPGLDAVPAWFGQPFTVFAMVGVINALNVSDGLDGLAGGESVLSLLVIAFLAYLAEDGPLLVITLAVLGGTLGFLRFNTHPARVFMGDTGSQFLGFCIAFATVVLTQQSDPALSPALVLLLIGLPLGDIAAAVWRRKRKGLGSFEASRDHLHHRLLDLGFIHYEVVVLIYSLQAICVMTAVLLRYESDALVMGAYAVLVGSALWLIGHAERTGWRPHGVGVPAFDAPFDLVRRRPALRRVPLHVVQALTAVYLIAGAALVEEVSADFGLVALVLVAALGLAQLFGRAVPTLQRTVIYAAAIFVTYLLVDVRPAWSAHWEGLELIFFVALAAAVALTVRLAEADAFRTTPTDYLLAFAVLTMGVFSGRLLELETVLLVVLRVLVVLYACEVLVTHDRRRWPIVALAGSVSLVVLGWRSSPAG